MPPTAEVGLGLVTYHPCWLGSELWCEFCFAVWGSVLRDREGQRERERERERGMESQTGRDRDREKERQRTTQTHKHTQKESKRVHAIFVLVPLNEALRWSLCF